MTDADLDGGRMPLLDHLVELRRRLIWCFAALILAWIGCYYFGQQLLDFLIRPLAAELADRPGRHLQFTALTEAFLTRVKVALWAAAFISFPVIATQIWLFVAPGLYKNERAAFLPYLFATPILFFAGGALVYYVVYPNILHFFLSFETPGGIGSLPVEADLKISEYLNFSLLMIFAFGLAFQMPVALTLCARVGLLSARQLRKGRRYAILGNTVAAALFTPPDGLSMLSLAVPLWLLYEISIWTCLWVERGRAKRAIAPVDAA